MAGTKDVEDQEPRGLLPPDDPVADDLYRAIGRFIVHFDLERRHRRCRCRRTAAPAAPSTTVHAADAVTQRRHVTVVKCRHQLDVRVSTACHHSVYRNGRAA